MSNETKTVGDEESQKSKIKPAQVVAAALSAVVAAFLCSTLGVYGTVLGAGLLSVVTTVGSEVFTRSMERTRAAARARAAGGRHHGWPEPRAANADQTVYLGVPSRQQWAEHSAAMERTRVLTSVDRAAGHRTRRAWWRRHRWPVLAATSTLAFMVGMLVVTGYESVTGQALSGSDRTTVGGIVRSGDISGGGLQTPDREVPAPASGTEVPSTEQPSSDTRDADEHETTDDNGESDDTERSGELESVLPSVTPELTPQPDEPQQPEPAPSMESSAPSAEASSSERVEPTQAP